MKFTKFGSSANHHRTRNNSPPPEVWQAKPDGVVLKCKMKISEST